jgi:hypothetical protein
VVQLGANQLESPVPRTPAEALTVVRPDTTVTQPRLTPPSSLTASERLEFAAIVSENQHLRRTDAMMLGLFVVTAAKAQKLARGKDVAAAEKAIKLSIALARSMRLTSQSVYDPKTIGRANRRPSLEEQRAIMEKMDREAWGDDAEDDNAET